MTLRTYKILFYLTIILLSASVGVHHQAIEMFFAVLIPSVFLIFGVPIPRWLPDASRPKYLIEEYNTKFIVYKNTPYSVGVTHKELLCVLNKEDGKTIEDCCRIIEDDKPNKIHYNL